MKQTDLATQRVTVLMTPGEKTTLEAKAKGAGVSVGEYVRRSLDVFDPNEAAELLQLAALAAELQRSNAEAATALDRALASIDQTRTQIQGRNAA